MFKHCIPRYVIFTPNLTSMTHTNGQWLKKYEVGSGHEFMSLFFKVVISWHFSSKSALLYGVLEFFLIGKNQWQVKDTVDF